MSSLYLIMRQDDPLRFVTNNFFSGLCGHTQAVLTDVFPHAAVNMQHLGEAAFTLLLLLKYYL